MRRGTIGVGLGGGTVGEVQASLFGGGGPGDSRHGPNGRGGSDALAERSKVVLTAWLERYVPLLVHRCCSSANADDGSFDWTPLNSLCNGAQLLALVLERHSSSLLPQHDHQPQQQHPPQQRTLQHQGSGMEDNGASDGEQGEERVKGTLTMLTLAVAMYVSAFWDYEEEYYFIEQMNHDQHSQSQHLHDPQQQQQQQQHRTHWANAVLSNLGSALSITALRLRYRPTSNQYTTPLPSPSCPPLIDMLVHAVDAVRDAAQVYFSSRVQQLAQRQPYQPQWERLHPHRQQQQTVQTLIRNAHQHALQRSIAACLSSLPETVLLPPGQSSEEGQQQHRIPSVDRACLRAASMELRSVASVGSAGIAGGSSMGCDSTISGCEGRMKVGTGMDRAWKVLMDSERNGMSHIHHDTTATAITNDGLIQMHHEDASASRLLEFCEAWARFVSVPIHVIDETVGKLAVQYLHVSSDNTHRHPSVQRQKAQEAAFQYLVAIFEGASPSLTPQDVLAAALGVAAGRGGGGGGCNGNKKNKNTKKKQGNKSKRRHEARLGRAISAQDEEQGPSEENGMENGDSSGGGGVGSGTIHAAEEELLERRNVACAAAAAAFGVVITDTDNANNTTVKMGDDWGLRLAASSSTTSSHGICSTVAAAASSVLPHLLWLEREEDGGSSGSKWRLELFSVIMVAIRRLCESPDRDVRALAYEPLMILHTSLNSVTVVCLSVEQIAVDAICEVRHEFVCLAP